jgi:hypothetical protein
MALVLKDRVKETTVSTGTGAVVLGGASTGYQSFSVIGDGNTTYYTITDGTSWEVGVGTYTAATLSLSRDTILESSNSGNAVNWGVGVKDVFCTMPAEKAMAVDGSTGPVIITANSGVGTSALSITQTGSGNALLVEDSANPDSTPTLIDRNGNLVLGHTLIGFGSYAINSNTVQSHTTKSNFGSFASQFLVANWSSGSGSNYSPDIAFMRFKSNVIGTRTGNSSGDYLGSIIWFVSDGNNFQYGTTINAIATSNATADLYVTVLGKQYLSVDALVQRKSTSNSKTSYVLRSFTSDATPENVTIDLQSPTATNQVSLVNSSAISFTGLVTARQKASAGTASAAWKIEGLIRREANAASTTLVASTVTAIDNTPGWTVALSADTTNGALAIQVTGASSTLIVWTASVDTSEAVYA